MWTKMKQNNPESLLVSISVVLLSLCDAMLTIQIVDKGGVELNPIMHQLLESNISLFVVVKMLLTVFGITILSVYNKVGMLYFVLAGYFVLLAYELVLLNFIIP